MIISNVQTIIVLGEKVREKERRGERGKREKVREKGGEEGEEIKRERREGGVRERKFLCVILLKFISG